MNCMLETCGRSPDCAKRLECAGFSGALAFDEVTDEQAAQGVRWRAVLKSPQSRRFARCGAIRFNSLLV